METVHRETNEEQGVEEAMVAVADRAPDWASGSSCSPRWTSPPRSPSSSTGRAPACSRSPTASATSSAPAAVLRERGLRLLYDEPRRGTADSRVNFIHPKDAGGVLVELVQPAPR